MNELVPKKTFPFLISLLFVPFTEDFENFCFHSLISIVWLTTIEPIDMFLFMSYRGPEIL